MLPKGVKFDGIFLSNIYDWLNYQNQERYIAFVKKELVNYLTDRGLIAVYYPVGGCNDKYLDNVFDDFIDMGSRGKTIIYKKSIK